MYAYCLDYDLGIEIFLSTPGEGFEFEEERDRSVCQDQRSNFRRVHGAEPGGAGCGVGADAPADNASRVHQVAAVEQFEGQGEP